ncbi:B12-binding domain-containing protein [uncultured Litoreibacter sp.]|uniref:cobalamin B12-binding domain-containing protein n=1 Tax=uncultured Litoreibacter sp. TaxID=1392394 RepID=UPI002619AA28|nr:cobalamin B12-binding domain-containing protein [uncultured Litoreibacter sp.]
MPKANYTCEEGATPDVVEFALRALSRLAEDQRMFGHSDKGVFELFASELYNAVSDPDRTQIGIVKDKMLQAGISTYDMADNYIPHVARRLGEAWCADNIDFAVTTIGSARLQGLLRSLGPEWCADDSCTAASAPKCLVVVPEGAQHTLGATILAGQLRRAGISVSLEVGIDLAQLEGILTYSKVEAVMVSASSRESLEVIRQIVRKVRATGRDVPVIVGGNVLSQNEDVARVTGADFATSSVLEAIGFCGFNARMLRVVSKS